MVKARRERQQRKAANIPLTILLPTFFYDQQFLQFTASLFPCWNLASTRFPIIILDGSITKRIDDRERKDNNVSVRTQQHLLHPLFLPLFLKYLSFVSSKLHMYSSHAPKTQNLTHSIFALVLLIKEKKILWSVQ